MLPRIAMLSTYPPTKCGIATFAQSLRIAMEESGCAVDVIEPRASDGGQRLVSLDAQLEQTVSAINARDVLLIQHEYGIFGGPDGEDVLELVARTRVPVISVLHTVLERPSENQRRVLRALVAASDAVVVMSMAAYRRLVSQYGAATSKLRVIPHGSADLRATRDSLTAFGQPQLLTWGLISRGKGIEWGIIAMALLARRDLRMKYVIAGQVHPNASYGDGVKYRDELVELAVNLGVAENVEFVDEYLGDQDLRALMASSSAFLLPYDTKEQVTSGVLVEAVTAGGPVIATRFPHANELLGYGAGYVVRQKDAQGMANAIRSAHTDLRKVAQMRRRNLHAAEEFIWSHVGAEYAQLADDVWRRKSPHGNAIVEMAVGT